jgi:hypothetical protein
MKNTRFALLLLVFIMAGHAQPVSLDNPGFEETGDGPLPAGWHNAGGVYTRDTDVSRSGQAALQYQNSDPEKYIICSRPVALEKGCIYVFSAWVRTQDVQGGDSGATLCIEYRDREGKYLGGSYPPGVKGDTDWTRVEGRTGRVPEDAASMTISCYVRKGMTGTAWWDDVEIARERETPMRTVLMQPNYRGESIAGALDRARIGAELNLRDYEESREDVQIEWRLLRASDSSLLRDGRRKKLKSDNVILEPSIRRIEAGAYILHLALKNRETEAVLAESAHRLEILARKPEYPVRIDEHNRVLVHGKPFFPLGMYWGGVKEEQLAVYADSAFNCLMPYSSPDRAMMDRIHAYGLKVIYSIKDLYHGTKYCPASITSAQDADKMVRERVAAFRTHPALLAWYINDELPPEMLPRLTARQRLLEECDPGHPAWAVLCQVDQVHRYLSTFDIIGTDPYPVPSRPVSLAAAWTAKTRGAVMNARPVWQVPQMHNWAIYRKNGKGRPPTFDEMRSMAWQCIAEGANGIVFYSWFDLHRDPAASFEERWPEVKAITEEIAGWIPALLSVEEAPRIEAAETSGVNWRVFKKGGDTFLVVVNHGREDCSALFRLPRRPALIREHNPPHAATPLMDGRTLVLEMPALKVRHLLLKGF